MILRPAVGGQPPQMVFVTVPNIPAPQPDPPELSEDATQVFYNRAGVILSRATSKGALIYGGMRTGGELKSGLPTMQFNKALSLMI